MFLFSSNIFPFPCCDGHSNMAHQHWESQLWLDNAEKLRLYAQSTISKYLDLDASLAKAKSKSKNLEWEAKAGGERTTRVEKERDEAKHEVKVAYLAASAAGDSKARADEDMARVQEALAAKDEGRCKAKEDLARV